MCIVEIRQIVHFMFLWRRALRVGDGGGIEVVVAAVDGDVGLAALNQALQICVGLQGVVEGWPHQIIQLRLLIYCSKIGDRQGLLLLKSTILVVHWLQMVANFAHFVIQRFDVEWTVVLVAVEAAGARLPA